ncbi:hypothetical protein B0F90DRAFT_1629671 [Multifurca ochricompacta]|uniref:ER transporter 6TM N-terminal domain-containing protein n=1 Tax=Multifurca ochricompacta TaxID=376703 RepID=A0AAD4M3V4_9AGAM|nr:hypothetical protein B0F90DRAFT_1629671 [Multifurca ochricompacta]
MSKPELSSSQPGASNNTTAGKPSTSVVSRASNLVHNVWDFIRPQPWVINNIRQKKSQKLLFRSWLPGWGALILMLPGNSLRTIGTLGYFGMLFSVFIPPMFPVQIYLVIVVQSLLGLLVGWGIGSAAMKAALAVRSQVLIEATLQKAPNNFQGSVNPDQVYKAEVFKVTFWMLGQSSVMFGVFMGFGAMIFALIRAKSAPFLFFSIFGTIVLDIFCSIGPLYPFPNYKIVNSILISSSSYCAMALVCCFVFFPETVNHAYLGLISTVLGKVEAMLSSQEGLLSPKPGDFAPGCPKLKALTGARVILMTMYQNLAGLTVHLQSEFSIGRWSGDDVFGLADPVLAVVARINGLLSFAKHLRDLPSPPEAFADMPAPGTVSSDTHLLHHVFNPDITRESILKVTLIEALPHVRNATAELRAATIEGVAATRAMIDAINNDRLFSRSGPIAPLEERLDAASDKLRATLKSFKEQGTDAILGAYAHKPRADIPLRSLYIGYVFSSTAVIIGEVVLSFVQTVAETTARRRRVRLWAPSSLRHVVHALLKGRRKNEEQAFGEEESNETYVDEDDVQEMEYREYLDPDSHPPTNIFQKFMNLLHHFLQWVKTAEAIFVFRYVLITILLWLPSVVKNSAHFFYVNKGIWALIMAQTILTVYAGDQLYNYLIRIVGTFLGLITALVIWYIGNGSGNGSPYGLAASYAVLSLPVMFIRLFAPPKYLQGVILGCITVTLIIGFSWIDGHLPVISDPGIGWNAAWRRWTLVMIGCGASFIIMMLPPKSGRKAVRLRAAASIDALSHVYTSLISAWITESDEGKGASFASSSWVKAFRDRLIAVTLQIQTGKQQMMLASWEGGIRGRWPQEEYVKLTEVQEDMIGVLAQLGGALWKLDTKWRLSLLHHTKVVDPNFISDIVSVFSSVSQSLRTGEPMHTVLPQTLLDRLLLHHQTGVIATGELDGHREIGPDEIQSLDHMFYTSAVIAVYQLMQCLDELQAITRRLCGEVPLRGFEKWKFLHKSRRGTRQNTLSRTGTIVEREPLITNEKSGEEGEA